jgi:stage V sporulation protein B
MSSVATERGQEVARTAGRGILFITFAKLFFIVAGYAIHFALPRLLGSKELYDSYGIVASLVNVLNMVVIQGTLQAVSKLVSEDESRAPDVRRAALKVQAWVGGGLVVAFFAGADLVATVQREPELALYYRISSAVVLCYGFYAVFIGVLNGRREFRRQALFDMSYATLRTSFMIAAAAAGLSVVGVFAGFSAASFLIFAAAFALVGVRGGAPSPELERRLRAFMLPVMLYTLVLNLLLTADLWVLKGVLTDDMGGIFAAHGAASAMAKEVTADYFAAQVIARIPYQLTLSVTFVIFPLVSRATFEGDRASTQQYIRVTLRYSLIVLAAMVSVLASAAPEVVVIPYPNSYQTAGEALQILAPGMLFFALFSIIGSIITGSGRASLALGLGLGTLICDVVLCFLLIPAYGKVGAAMATCGALFAGTLAGLFVLWRGFRAALPPLSLVRVAVACAAVAAASYALPSSSKLFTIAKCCGLTVLYFALLLATGELGREDWRRVRQIFARRLAAKEAR